MITAYTLFTGISHIHIDIYRSVFSGKYKWKEDSMSECKKEVCWHTQRIQGLLERLEGYHGSVTCLCPWQNSSPPVLRRVFLVTECAVKGGMHMGLWRRKETPSQAGQPNQPYHWVDDIIIQMNSVLGFTNAVLGRLLMLLRPQGGWEYGYWLHPLDCSLGQGDLYALLEICYFKMSSVVSSPKNRDENVELFLY